MVSDDRKPSLVLERCGSPFEELLKGAHLMVDLYSQRLEHLCEEFVSRICRDGALDGSVQFTGGADSAPFPCGDNPLRDPSGVVDFPVDAQDPFQVFL